MGLDGYAAFALIAALVGLMTRGMIRGVPRDPRDQAEDAAWRRAAHELGLTAKADRRSPVGATFLGTLDGRGVTISVALVPDSDHHAATVSVAGAKLPRGLAITEPARLFRRSDLATADEVFDRGHAATGDEATVAAVLDATTRRELTRLAARVDERGLTATRRFGPWDLQENDAELLDLVRSAVALARRLEVTPEDVPRRLAAIALEDPVEAVRERAFALLRAHFPGASLETAAALAKEPVLTALRLAAAQHLGDAGLEDVRAIAAAHATRLEVRRVALAHLAARMPLGELAAVVNAAFDDPEVEVQRWALGLAVTRRIALDPPRLVPLLSGRPDVALAAVRALEVAEGTKVSEPGSSLPALTAALAHPSAEVRAAVARLLGRVGTLEAVAPLLEAAEKATLLEGETKRAAEEAVRAIQARSGVLGAGARLSLAEGDGKLSLSESDEGAVSLEADS